MATYHSNILVFVLLCLVARINPASYVHFNGQSNAKNRQTIISTDKITEAVNFAKKHAMDTSVAFLVDMSIHSGRNRFFIVDLQLNKIIAEGLCCHGLGKGSTVAKPIFSNDIGSNCTSLGKYKTGARSYSNYGIHVHYKLFGLEKTNHNAFKRTVVLHAYTPVPAQEIFPRHLPMGWSLGCPVISNTLMTQVDKLLKAKKKPVLLWIYE